MVSLEKDITVRGEVVNITPTLFLVVGVSAMGKTTCVRGVKERLKDFGISVKLPVSYTTRSPREGEVNGRDYFFVGKEEFLKFEREFPNGKWDVDEFNGAYYFNKIDDTLPGKNGISILPVSIKAYADMVERYSSMVAVVGIHFCLSNDNLRGWRRNMEFRNGRYPREEFDTDRCFYWKQHEEGNVSLVRFEVKWNLKTDVERLTNLILNILGVKKDEINRIGKS